MPLRRLLLASTFPLLGIPALLLAGCATPGETGIGPPDARLDVANAGIVGAAALRPMADDVATVQLHLAGDEASLPLLALGSGDRLTLSFDRLGEQGGRPLSVFFYHADRTGRRDLAPVEYLEGFTSGEIRDYRPSASTRIDYVHYRYDFPNTDLDFRISGNYVIRVTELGQEEKVLLERAFFVTEQRTEVDLALGAGALAGSGSFAQPLVRLTPEEALGGQLFDYTVCFARNGRFGNTRCAEDASLVSRALYQFELPRERAFPVEGPLYAMNIGELRPGPDVDRVDFSADLFEIVLARDYARFGNDLSPEALVGQPVVAGVTPDLDRPHLRAEYVETVFTFVPDDEREQAGPVLLSGAFNGWAVDPAYRMGWSETDRAYTATLLLKQGAYLYRYVVSDPEEQATRRRELGVGQGSLYTALVYFRDARLGTDRLVGSRTVFGQQ